MFILGVAAFGICISVLTVILFSGMFLLTISLLHPPGITDPHSASILLPILFFTTRMSLTALSFLLSLFLAQRLYTHVMTTTTSAADYKGMSKGVKDWLDETADRLPNVPPVGWAGRTKTEPHVALTDKHTVNGTVNGENEMLVNARMKPEFGVELGGHPFDRSPAPGIKF